MKNLIRIMTAVLVLNLIFIQCQNDDDEEARNSISYNGQSYDLDKGILENYGILNGSGNNIDLTLLSSGLTVHVTGDVIDSISGIGNGITFEMFTSGTTGLSVGDYVFDTDSSAGTFDFGNMVLNFNTTTEQGINLDVTTGTVSVKQAGPVYEITFNCMVSDGKGITGYYKGPLQYYDYTSNGITGLTKSAIIKKRWWK